MATTASHGLPPGHILLALAVVAIWGTNFVVIRIALDELPPLTLATLRFAFALVPAVFFVRRPRVPWASIAAYGLLIGFGQFALLLLAMNGRISPGLASLVVQSQVFFTIGIAMWRSGEQVRGFQIGALLLAVAGIGVILAHADRNATPLGLAMVLAAALSWAAGNIVARETGVRAMFGYVVWSNLFAVPPLALCALLVEGPGTIAAALAHASPGAWVAVVWQAAGNTLFGLVMWGWLLARHPAATITPMALLIPVFGIGTSALMLGETLPAWKLAAGALVLGGLAINVLWPVRHRLPGLPWRRGAAT
ncbi:EamA family transporter [Sphingomonas solaris]|uniref:EamA family transporter n=1 Tax=Alterirhizorhabdus solaris TaxID=2529389 RepID=A0A558QRT3_9SPHN|nr:EamA family transporter [Sphingomonas solaris]TVV69757.1 EamA family transporter [Sphingomonas solaris]